MDDRYLAFIQRQSRYQGLGIGTPLDVGRFGGAEMVDKCFLVHGFQFTAGNR